MQTCTLNLKLYELCWPGEKMEACVLVEREQDKIIKKLNTLHGSTAIKLQQLIDQVAELKGKFEEGWWLFQLMPTLLCHCALL